MLKRSSGTDFHISRRFFLKSISACSFILISGCQKRPELVPKISRTYEPSLSIPPKVTVNTPVINNYQNVPYGWIPPSSVEKGWSAIIVHHSGTDFGNAAIFDREHKNLGWDGVGYDFVIGNGTNSGDGEVEVTFRWKQQITGAHCRAEPDNWANKDGIGICLVGNFNNYLPTQKQMESLVKLTNFLKRRYGISPSLITGHGQTRGAHVTDCPGTRFSVANFKRLLAY